MGKDLNRQLNIIDIKSPLQSETAKGFVASFSVSYFFTNL